MEINLDPGRTPAELSPISASQTAALLRSGLAIGSELLGEAFPSVIKNVSAELGSRWDFDQLTPIVQRLLSSRPDDLRSSFLARLKEAQDEAYATLTADRQAPRFAHELSGFDAETLSLVDAFAVDSNTVVEKSANKLGGLLDQAMGDLNLVLGHIAGRGALKTNENPLGPFVVVKADAGTYGMGVMTVKDAAEVKNLNRKQRNKMAVVKEGLQVSDVLIQEGVPTVEHVDGGAAEPVVYMMDRYVVGGFYRVHTGRGVDENLNAPGMHFAPMPFAGSCNLPECGARGEAGANRLYAFGVVARLALLAASLELERTVELAADKVEA